MKNVEGSLCIIIIRETCFDLLGGTCKTFKGCLTLYVPETHIMYFIRRCWFLKCSEEIHYVPIGAGVYVILCPCRWWLGRSTEIYSNVYITSQYFSLNAKYWTASSGNRTRAPPDRMWTLYHWAMESVPGTKYGCAKHTLRPSTSLQMPNIELHRPGIDPGPPW